MQFVVSVNQFLKEHSFLSAFVAICTGLMIMWQLITVAVSAEVETKVASVREQVIKNTKDIRTVQRDIGEIKLDIREIRSDIKDLNGKFTDVQSDTKKILFYIENTGRQGRHILDTTSDIPDMEIRGLPEDSKKPQ